MNRGVNRLALFDCDGTLVDSQANICRAMEGAFAGAGLVPPKRAAIRRNGAVELRSANNARLIMVDEHRIDRTEILFGFIVFGFEVIKLRCHCR